MTTAAVIEALTPRFDLDVDDRIIFRSASWAPRRRGKYVDLLDPRSGELVTSVNEV